MLRHAKAQKWMDIDILIFWSRILNYISIYCSYRTASCRWTFCREPSATPSVACNVHDCHPPDLEEPAVKEKKMERLAELAKTRGVMGAYGGLALRLRDLVESKPASLQKWQIKLPKIMKASSFHLGFGGFMEFTFQLLMFLVRRNGRQDTLIRDGSTNKEWFCSVSGPGLVFFEPAWWSLWMHGSLFQGLVFQI